MNVAIKKALSELLKINNILSAKKYKVILGWLYSWIKEDSMETH